MLPQGSPAHCITDHSSGKPDLDLHLENQIDELAKFQYWASFVYAAGSHPFQRRRISQETKACATPRI